MKNTFYLTVEGTDGAGKTTLVKHLLKYFEDKGLSVLLTKEFGSKHDKFCEEARALALSSDYKVDEVAGQILWGSIIRQHQEKVIKPNLGRYDIILSDRGMYSNYCYGPEHQKTQEDKDFVINFFDSVYQSAYKADVSLFINIPLELAEKRRLARTPEAFKNNGIDRVEAKGLSFQEKVKSNFVKMSQDNTDLKVLYVEEKHSEQDVLDLAIKIIESLPFYSFKC